MNINVLGETFLSASGLEREMRRRLSRRRFVLFALGTCLCLLVLFALGSGPVEINPAQIGAILLHRVGIEVPVLYEVRQETVLMAIRLPRVLLALVAGAALSVSGAALQGLFRNPLADPGLIGVSAGAALGAVTVLVLGPTLFQTGARMLGLYLLPFSAFAGALATTAIIFQLSTIQGRTSVSTMLLAGIAVNALIGAAIGYFTYIATDEQLRSLTFWTMGSLSGATWKSVFMVLPLALVAVILLSRQTLVLNALLLGEAPAVHLGFHVQSSKKLVIIFSALAVGATVAVTGAIGFIGLVVPHLVRMLLGPDHRLLLPASATLGAILLLGADLVARTVVAPAELPTGIVTAAFGAPFFLWLLLRERKSYD